MIAGRKGIGNLRSWALADRERRKSQDIVVSARGWLVVNLVGVATPTVGWKRAPLSAVVSIAEVFLISVLLILHFEIYMLSYMFMGLWNCKCFH